MSFFNEFSNKHVATREYKPSYVNETFDVAKWMFDLKKIPDLTIKYFRLSDLLNCSDEGNDSLQIDGSESYENVGKLFNENWVDIISATGKYEGKPVVIGFDHREKLIYISLRKKELANIERLENKLHL